MCFSHFTSTIQTSRDAYVRRLNGIYENLLNKSKVDYIPGWGKFTDDGCIEVNGQKYKGKHTMIASGGRPSTPDIPGKKDVRLFLSQLQVFT